MLINLLSGEEDWEFIVIEDFAHLGRGLFNAFIHQHLKRGCEIHLLSYNSPPGYILSNAKNKIIYHDGYTDPAGWKNDPNILNKITYNTDLEAHFREHLIDQQKEFLIAIDLLRPLVLNKSVAEICILFKRLQRFCKDSDKKFKLLCLFHNQSNDNFIVECLENIASTILSLFPATSCVITCNILHKRNGKPSKEKINFHISSNLDVRIEKPNLTTTKRDVMQQKPDPTSGLTFKLELDEKEKVARGQLVLPYTKKSNESEIIYEYDENDDFDEEDPDDDLNI
uniref:Elongator complex protein 5 n=1 Tax=Strigamia maritima TaxID=126957 RepID=T1JMR2_STRMM